MTKYRVIRDHAAAVSEPWFRLEVLSSDNNWQFIRSGYEDAVRLVVDRLKAGEPLEEVIEEFIV